MLSELKIILTGATGQVGAAIVHSLSDFNIQMVLAGRDIQTLKSYSMTPYVAHLHTWEGDLSREENCRDLIAFSAASMGGIDILINNAGVFHFSPLENISYSDISEILNINVQAPAYLTQLAIPYLKESKHPVVLNISSLAGLASLPGGACYSSSKWALQGLTHSIREELLKDKIRVCSISPCQIESLYTSPLNNVHTITSEAVAKAVSLTLELACESSLSLDLTLN